METKENKKGFWASLFAPKQSSCCCSLIEEVKESEPSTEQNAETTASDEKPKNDSKPSCSCGGNC